MNPIFLEYYPHESCMCYKINLPWTRFAKETVVLCTVKQGIVEAKKLAKHVINRRLKECLAEPISAAATAERNELTSTK